MGHEFEIYEITSLTLVRNDSRATSFNENVSELEERAPLLPPTPHWVMTPDDVVRRLRLQTTSHAAKRHHMQPLILTPSAPFGFAINVCCRPKRSGQIWRIARLG